MSQIQPGDLVAYTDRGIERTAVAAAGPATIAGSPVIWIRRLQPNRRIEVTAVSAHLVRPLPIVKPKKKAGAAS